VVVNERASHGDALDLFLLIIKVHEVPLVPPDVVRPPLPVPEVIRILFVVAVLVAKPLLLEVFLE
jgi:hypothetical protein